tara:strand:+ start:1032 stop:2300 length:1269 start_codon:yes stop_codon:yes gene_type:complete
MKKRLFPLLIALSALTVSGSAAFYSVFGLSKLFAGASTQVIIMAGSLEFAKLVVASLLYQYWDTINKWLRTYLAIACFILMIITSGGIYGFLSGAYQSTANQSELLDKSLMILNQKQVRFEESKEDLTIEKTQINKSISDLRISLSSPTSVSYWDKNSQTVITTSSSSARRALQAELKTTILDRDNINTKIESVMDSINKTDIALLDKEVSNEAESELGPLKYLAETTGQPMNQVVNWFLLLIIFVFDPLAIALVVAANMAFAQIRNPEDSKLKTDLDDINDKPYSLEEMRQQEEIEGEYFKDLQSYRHHTPVDIDENRMNIIGQNGNDGLHYNEEDIALDRLTDTTQTLIVDKQKNFKVIESNNQLKEEELIELSKEIGKKELADEEPIKPTEEDLEKLALALNISKKEEDDDKKLRYKGR